MQINHLTIFERMLAGGIITYDDPEYYKITEVVNTTMQWSVELNNATERNQIRKCLEKIIDKKVDESTTVFVPFHTNFGRFIHIGRNAFINKNCTFLDLGGITIDDDVLIGPNVQLITENHPVKPSERKALELKSIHIQKNVWIGAGAIILPGVTVGENSVVAAGAVVSKDVPANTIAGGVPARILKNIEH
ncbi:sugar O-acetyltransferase [Emticicia sp. BO119]|uniref:sugar O-acetyltransferase n=1 Tax=Emticicia sp. BO119 TaxID=2757768 RepID=UPI0015F12599|nr:sugar O-acetyltransferase [Emticicia sp. BO119]MBA4851429.1 sugar O-acetyltransferase [Emticicia sp. BO119]